MQDVDWNSRQRLPAEVLSSDERRSRSRVDRPTSWALIVVLVPIVHLAVFWTDSTPLLVVLLASMCGVLIGVDGVHWLRGGYDTFSPVGLLGLFGVHFFWIAPMLHYKWQFWAQHVVPPPDWDVAVERLLLCNFAGLLIYRTVLAFPRKRAKSRDLAALELRKFGVTALAAATLSALALAYLVFRLDGPVAYFLTAAEQRVAFRGFGPLLLIGEALPLIVFALLIVTKRDRLRSNIWLLVSAVALFLICQFLIGGLRGSRSNTVWPTLIALGLIHTVVRPVRVRVLIASGLVGLVFMYTYALYKGAGTDALDIVSGDRSASQLISETGRDVQSLALVDFGRTDVQALVLDRSDRGHITHAFGQTYLGDLSFLLPQAAAAELLPPGKVYWGTNALYGTAASEAGYRSSRVYGLVGEATLNFGLAGAVASFGFLGLALRWLESVYMSMSRSGDLGRRIVAPTLCVYGVLLLGMDIDNVLWFAVKQTLPLVVIVWCARRAGRPRFERKGTVQSSRGSFPVERGWGGGLSGVSPSGNE